MAIENKLMKKMSKIPFLNWIESQYIVHDCEFLSLKEEVEKNLSISQK